MKISMYTFLFEIDSKFYAYNTLSNALIEIAEDTYKIVFRSVEQPKTIRNIQT